MNAPIDVGQLAALPPWAPELIRRNVDLEHQVGKLTAALRHTTAALERHATPNEPEGYTEAVIVLRDVELTVHYAPDDDAYNILAAYIGRQDVLRLVDIDELEAQIYVYEQARKREAEYDRAEDIAAAQAEADRQGWY